MQKYILFFILICCLASCTKEIDFDYNEIDAIVVIEGRVTNEGTYVCVTKSRSMTDSVKSPCLLGAAVTITTDGVNEAIAYDPQTRCYHSAFKGQAGETYKLTVDFEGKHYEGTSTMPAAAPILSTEFIWFDVLDDRMVVYEMWASEPVSMERNYYWYRMDRTTHHPHFEGRLKTEPYQWSVFDNRGNPPGRIYRDIFCMSKRMAEEDEEENWDHILYEGDTITFQLMGIDRSTYDYFSSLRAGQSGGANPKSNLTGGCTGYFAAGSITRADTLVFSYDTIHPEATFNHHTDAVPSKAKRVLW